MTLVGEWCRRNGIYVRSGHADGADYAFEQGAQDHAIVYMPWRGFGSDRPLLTKHVVYPKYASGYARQSAKQSVFKFHPRAHSLGDTAMRFMTRNYYQVMGSKTKKKPVNAIVCWTPNGSGSGGTGQALRIGQYYDIPVLDLGHKFNCNLKIHTIIEWIETAIKVTTQDREHTA